jgi:hypothetical protein
MSADVDLELDLELDLDLAVLTLLTTDPNSATYAPDGWVPHHYRAAPLPTTCREQRLPA